MKSLIVVLLLTVTLLGQTSSFKIYTASESDTVEINGEFFITETGLIRIDSLEPGWYKIRAKDDGSTESELIQLNTDEEREIRYKPDHRKSTFILSAPMHSLIFTEESIFYGHSLQLSWFFPKNRFAIGTEISTSYELSENQSLQWGVMGSFHKNILMSESLQFETGLGVGWIGWFGDPNDYGEQELKFYSASFDTALLWGRSFVKGKAGYNLYLGSEVGHRIFGGVVFLL